MLLVLFYWVASVWKHPESQYWTACFRDQNDAQRLPKAEKKTSTSRRLSLHSLACHDGHYTFSSGWSSCYERTRTRHCSGTLADDEFRTQKFKR